ncbi:hypothetical protein NDA16_003270 [Ustilago loliicola]|nr:hypothetical protein NDA16_003270 [Ustilago loliicola]
MSLPYAADAETSLSPSELQVLKSQYESELAAGHVTTQTKFNYAWGLVKSKNRADMSVGMGNYDEARRFNAVLIEREPNNLQAQSLNQLIEKGVAREGYLGMALIGGAAAVASIAVAGLMRRGRR